jgi:type VI protein secretion system component Hcp
MWFMQYPAIAGESTRAGCEQWIEVDSVSISANLSIPAGATGAQRNNGTSSIGNLHVNMNMDRSFPDFMTHSMLGKSTTTVNLKLVATAGQSTVTTLLYELENVFVADVDADVMDNTATATVRLELDYSKIKITYSTFNPETGDAQGQAPFTWDRHTAGA